MSINIKQAGSESSDQVHCLDFSLFGSYTCLMQNKPGCGLYRQQYCLNIAAVMNPAVVAWIIRALSHIQLRKCSGDQCIKCRLGRCVYMVTFGTHYTYKVHRHVLYVCVSCKAAYSVTTKYTKCLFCEQKKLTSPHLSPTLTLHQGSESPSCTTP